MVNDRGARRARNTPASPDTAAPDPDNDPSILPSKGQQSFGQHAGAFVRELLAVVIGAVIVASLLRGFVGQMFIIPSISMQNTLQIDDRVVVEKLSSIKRGQVVVFANPGGWLSGVVPTERGPVGQALEFVGVLPDTSTEHLIKRAVGMPGDHVVCCDAQGRITVNDVPLDETVLSLPLAGRGGRRSVEDPLRRGRAGGPDLRPRRQPRSQPRLALPPQRHRSRDSRRARTPSSPSTWWSVGRSRWPGPSAMRTAWRSRDVRWRPGCRRAGTGQPVIKAGPEASC